MATSCPILMKFSLVYVESMALTWAYLQHPTGYTCIPEWPPPEELLHCVVGAEVMQNIRT